MFYVLETGNPHEIIIDYRGGKDVIKVIFSSRTPKKPKTLAIKFNKAISVGY